MTIGSLGPLRDADAGCKPAQMSEPCPAHLARRANVLADWADRMPLRQVYIFGDHDPADAGQLKIAIEYRGDASDETMLRWQHASATDFAELQAALGVEVAVFTDHDGEIWAPIRDAARLPLLTVGKVKVVRTALL